MATTSLKSLLSNVGDLNFKRRITQILKYLDIQPGDKVLDCGCGDGFYTMILTELYDCEVHALDYNYKLLEEATRRIKRKDRLKLIEGDITDGLSFDDNFFDKIIFTEVLEHLDDDITPLVELKRVLKPGGKLAVTVPHTHYPFLWDPLNWTRKLFGLGHFNTMDPLLGGVWAMDHKRLYTPKKLEGKIKKAGLKASALTGFTHYTLPFNLLLLNLGKKFYTSLPLPESVVSSMEKFEGKDVKAKSPLVDIPFKLAKSLDGLNEGKNFVNKKSFITLFAGITK